MLIVKIIRKDQQSRTNRKINTLPNGKSEAPPDVTER